VKYFYVGNFSSYKISTFKILQNQLSSKIDLSNGLIKTELAKSYRHFHAYFCFQIFAVLHYFSSRRTRYISRMYRIWPASSVLG